MLAINNEIDRSSLAIDAIDLTARLQRIRRTRQGVFRNIQIDCRNHANKHAIDSPEITGWKWPY